MPDEVANVVVFMASDRASWVCGETVVVDGGRLYRENWFLADKKQIRSKSHPSSLPSCPGNPSYCKILCVNGSPGPAALRGGLVMTLSKALRPLSRLPGQARQ